MAFEVKSMRKWDFHSIDQASSCIQTWFSGSQSEIESLWKGLMSLDDKVPSQSPQKVRITFNDLLIGHGKHTKSSSIDDYFDVRECTHQGTDPDLCCEHQLLEKQNEQKTPRRQQDTDIEPVHYKDTLLKFFFDDRDLPFTFKRIITSDLRLLTLLESGLPSWVVFLQSYPLFCKVYRPWMRPLVRTLYILISLVTCVIGFYDLYKNVPVLKAAASHICGPFFIWIEDWDMISRVRYLGTMLFIQNFEKAMRWSIKIGQVLKLLLLLLTKPLMEPLQDLVEFTSPLWILLCEAGSDFYSMVSFALISLCSLVVDLFELLLSPFQLLYSYIVIIVSFFSPIFASVWDLCQVPLQMCSPMGNHAAFFFSSMYKDLQEMLMLLVSKAAEVGHLATRLSKAKPATTEVSMWSSLWKDLFSKVFRSLRSISHGLIAFLDSCNRHRLSTSNHLSEYIRRMSELLSSGLEASQRALPSSGLKAPQQALAEEGCQQQIPENHEHFD